MYNYATSNRQQKQVKSFRVGINQWISEQTETLIYLNDVDILIGYPRDMSPTFDLFVIVAKIHIYSFKFFGCHTLNIGSGIISVLMHY